MPKPTILQSILGRPSQSYSFPPQKDYHSTKHDLIRVATTSHSFEEDHSPAASVHSHHVSPSASLLSHPPPPPPSPRSRSRRFRRQRTPETTQEPHSELLPSRSLIRQIASSSSSSLQISQNHKNARPSAGTHALPPLPPYISPTHVRTPPPPSRLAVAHPVAPSGPLGGPSVEDSPDDDSDVFYTPRSELAPSPPSSSAPPASPDMPATLLEPQALASALLPLHGRPSLKCKSALAPPTLSRDPDVYSPHVRPSTDSGVDHDTEADTTVTPGPASDADPASAPVSRTASDSSLSSCSAAGSFSTSPSVSVSEHDTASLFDSAATTSTRVTTPACSVVGPPKFDIAERETETEVITIISSSSASARRPRPLSIDLSPASLAPRAASTIHATRRHSQPQPARTDEDWARDVRWLVPPPPASPVSPVRARPSGSPSPLPSPSTPASSTSHASASNNSPRRRARPLHPDLLPPPPALAALPAPHQLDRQPFPDLPTVAAPTPRPVRPRPKERRNSRHSQRHSRSRMSALWEEDESECSTDVGASSAEVSRASTPAPSVGLEGEWPYNVSGGTGGSPNNGPTYPGMRFVSSMMQRRASMSESELLQQMQRGLHADSPPPSPSESPDSKMRDYARQRTHQRSLSLSSPSMSVPSFISAPTLTSTPPGRTASPLAADSGLPTHALPAPIPTAPGAVQAGGYTGLTLPHASYTPKNGKPLADGRVDLVRAGRAQSSMATVEVVRGAAAALPASALTRTRTRLSRSFSLGLGRKKSGGGKDMDRRLRSRERAVDRDRDRDRDGATPAHLRGALPLAVAFTAHVAPPSFVPSAYVLVQVFAVGLDGLDSLMVQEKAERRSGGGGGSIGRGKRKRGFVPGRSFVGRAMECGFEVSREVCKRGEWVVGLLDVRKCGALAEFVLIERHRVFRCPQPRARPSYLFPPRRRTHSHTRTLSLPSAPHPPIVAAHQPHAPSPLAPPAPLTLEELALIALCGLPAHRAVRTFADVLASRPGKNPERPRVLILMGHDGPGAMALQMIGRKRAHICVQVPKSVVRDADEKEDSSEESVRSPAFSKRARVEARLRAWGAEEICVGEPLGILERFVDEGRSFDAVLDTVGGVCIWEAAQRLLATVPSAAATQSAPTLSAIHTAPEDLTSEELDEQRRKKETMSYAQFTTLVGDMPSRAVPKAQDNLRSGLRSLRRAMSTSAPAKGTASSTSTSRVFGSGGKGKVKRTVGYTWISVAADVDEGEDVRDSLGAVVAMVEGGKVRPWVGLGEEGEEDRVVPFERAPEAFRRDADGPRGVLKDGGTCVVKVCA